MTAAHELASPPDAPAPPRRRTPRLRLVPGTPETDRAAPEPTRVGAGQITLDLQFVLPGGLTAVPEAPSALLVPAPRRCSPQRVEEVGPPTDRAVLPPVGPWAARLAQAVLEVCTAGRPISQLLRWTEPSVYQELERRYTPRVQRVSRSRRVVEVEKIRSIHVCEPADGVAEVSAVIGGGERPRALAFRIEGWRGRWVCTALEWI